MKIMYFMIKIYAAYAMKLIKMKIKSLSYTADIFFIQHALMFGYKLNFKLILAQIANAVSMMWNSSKMYLLN